MADTKSKANDEQQGQELYNANRKEFVVDTSNTDSYGFVRENDFDYKSYETFNSVYTAVLTHRSQRWNKKLNKETFKHDKTTKRFCRKGIPQEKRSSVWMDVSGANRLMDNNPGDYQKLLSTPCSDYEFEENLKESVAIDIDRTFPNNVHFQNGTQEDRKDNLRNVLIAYGRSNTTVSYCQGMNYLAALLLLVVQDEEKCFWLLTALINNILPQYYANRMIALRADLAVLTELIEQKYPAIHKKVEEISASWTLVASKWFVCLFVDVLPVETVLRIWDCVLFEGSKVLFRVAMVLIHERKSEIMNCNNLYDFVDGFRQIRNDELTLQCHSFMKKCFNIPNSLPQNLINKLREKHTELLKQEDRDMELRRQQNA